MEGTANLVVYRNSKIIWNMHKGVRFVGQNPFSFVVPCTMTLMEFSERSLSKHGEWYVEENEQNSVPKFGCKADGIQNDLDIEDDRAAVYEGMNSDSKEDFEATYEAGDEDKNGNVGVEAAAENVVVHPLGSQSMNVPPFMCNLDLDAMHAPKFLEYANIGVVDPKDREFRIRMEYSSKNSVVAAIRSYTISRGVDYNVYESEPQTFYAKCKTYGRGCDCLIQRKKGDPETWPAYEGPTLVANPALR
ncbi:hypothetical protein Ahy_B03g068795 [Arachis hypogaea]|uniref:Transposase MuDR plant domain-containing protein n=1 Tax=Arachis hypogaea TaxID=3818 RepID=A0A445AAU4_ARAHY|nr:hypothetical protein Ahy_B03g068795 [Arachis hypogaea]